MPHPVKPYALHVAQGTNRSRVEKREAGSLKLKPGSLGECPAWLPPEGREEWERLTRDKDYARCLVPSTRGALIDYCNLFGRMIRSERRLLEWVDGKAAQDVTRPDGSVVEAAREKLTASERQTLHSLRMQLGLTPASQSKVQVADAEASDDGWSNF